IHVVPFGFPNQGVQNRAGEMTRPSQTLDAGHQRILVSPMKRVARLEGDHALPAALAEKGTGLGWRQNKPTIFWVFGLRQNSYIPPQEHVARVTQDHASAGVIGAFGSVDALDVTKFIKRENIANLERTDDFLAAVDQGDVVAGLERASQGPLGGKGDGYG